MAIKFDKFYNKEPREYDPFNVSFTLECCICGKNKEFSSVNDVYWAQEVESFVIETLEYHEWGFVYEDYGQFAICDLCYFKLSDTIYNKLLKFAQNNVDTICDIIRNFKYKNTYDNLNYAIYSQFPAVKTEFGSVSPSAFLSNSLNMNRLRNDVPEIDEAIKEFERNARYFSEIKEFLYSLDIKNIKEVAEWLRENGNL